MTEPATVISRTIWAVILMVPASVSVVYLASRARTEEPGLSTPEIRIPLPSFTLTERSGKPLGIEDLRGQVWIADFIFTSCAGPCPLMTQRMLALQDELADIPNLRLVSFSVDPDRDTPQVLRQYAERFGADPARWLFLTGPMERIYDLAIDGFKIAVEEARRDHQIIHDTRFMVVDADGVIRGYYDSTDPDQLHRLRRDVRALALR